MQNIRALETNHKSLGLLNGGFMTISGIFFHQLNNIFMSVFSLNTASV